MELTIIRAPLYFLDLLFLFVMFSPHRPHPSPRSSPSASNLSLQEMLDEGRHHIQGLSLRLAIHTPTPIFFAVRQAHQQHQ
jgi:hypothetical protein